MEWGESRQLRWCTSRCNASLGHVRRGPRPFIRDDNSPWTALSEVRVSGKTVYKVPVGGVWFGLYTIFFS